MNTNRIVGCSTPFEFLKQKYFAEYKAAGITAMELSVDAEYVYHGILLFPVANIRRKYVYLKNKVNI